MVYSGAWGKLIHEKNQKSKISWQCHEIFCFWFFYFFHESVSIQPQSIPYRLIQIFSKICGDIRKSRCTTGINGQGGKFATSVNDTGGKIAAGINDTGGKFATGISTTPANISTIFPSVVDTGGKFATGVNDTGGKFATGVNDTSGKQQEQFSHCWQPKMKIYLYANSTTQWCPKEIINIFLIEDFFHLPSVSTTPVANLELFEFKETALMAWGLGETDSWKKPEAKSLVKLSL
jgi:hypothetical protein